MRCRRQRDPGRRHAGATLAVAAACTALALGTAAGAGAGPEPVAAQGAGPSAAPSATDADERSIGAADTASGSSSTGPSGRDRGRSARAGDELAIADQTFTFASETPFEVSLVMPDGIVPAEFGAGSVVVVTSHRAIADRFGFHQAVDGVLSRTEDTFDVSLDPAVADPNLLSIEGDTVRIRVPTEALTRTPDALQFGQAGVHPIVLELRVGDRAGGRAVDEVTTYVNRLASTPSTAGDLSVSLVMHEPSRPVVGTDGAITAGASAGADVKHLAEVLAVIDAAAAEAAAMGVPDAAVPRAVLIEPSTLAAVVADDPELAAELLPGLERSVVLSTPRLPLDPSAAVGAGLEDIYATWLREGEDLVRSLSPTTATDRSVFVVDGPLADDGATMERDLGVRMLVLPYEFYDGLEGSLRGLTDISQLVTVELQDGSTVKAAIVDDFFARQMVDGADDPVLGAIEIAAELVVLADDIIDDGLIVDRHGVVLGLPDLAVPDADLMAELTPLLLSTPGLRLVEPAALERTTTTLLNDGRLVTVSLPDAAGPDLSARLDGLDEISADVLAYATMLPADATDVDRWTATIATFPSTAMSDTQVRAAIDRIEDDFAALRAAVVAPEPFSFTLPGRVSKVRFSLTNTSTTELTVRVRLSSPKIRFPDGDRIEVLPPLSETDVTVQAEALSNGKSSVFLRIYTPGGATDVAIVPEVVLTARVNSLAGVGQLITGAGLLLIVTWWAHHVRSNRRKQLAAKHQSRHPASAGRPPAAAGATTSETGDLDIADVADITDVADASDTTGASPAGAVTSTATGRPTVTEVSPDAAASSLPPS